MKRRLVLFVFLLLGQLANLVAAIRMIWATIVGSDQAHTLALAYDQLANAATNGHEDETISSRANRARLERRRWGCVLCKFLDWFEKDHCEKSAGA
jgi:hypothetical protein